MNAYLLGGFLLLAVPVLLVTGWMEAQEKRVSYWRGVVSAASFFGCLGLALAWVCAVGYLLCVGVSKL